MPVYEQRDGYVLVRLRVQPRASRNAVIVDNNGRVRVAVTAPPTGGAANKAVVAFIAKRLGVPKRAVALTAGAKAREKTLRIEDAMVEMVETALNQKK